VHHKYVVQNKQMNSSYEKVDDLSSPIMRHGIGPSAALDRVVWGQLCQ